MLTFFECKVSFRDVDDSELKLVFSERMYLVRHDDRPVLLSLIPKV